MNGSRTIYSKDKLETFYGKQVTIADRGLVENDAEELIIEPAKEKKIAFLVVGDPGKYENQILANY